MTSNFELSFCQLYAIRDTRHATRATRRWVWYDKVPTYNTPKRRAARGLVLDGTVKLDDVRPYLPLERYLRRLNKIQKNQKPKTNHRHASYPHHTPKSIARPIDPSTYLPSTISVNLLLLFTIIIKLCIA